MIQRIRLAAGVALASLLISVPALAGPGWDLKIEVSDEGESSQAVVKLDATHLRGMAVGGNEEMILTEESITVIDHDEKAYMVIPFAMVEQMMGGMMQMAEGMKDAQIEALKSAMEGMDEDQRAEVEKQIAQLEKSGGMSDDSASDVDQMELKASGKSADVAGLKTKHYDVLKNGDKVADAWFTTEIEFGLFRSLFDRFSKMMPEGSTQDIDAFFALLDQAEGVPVKLVSVEGTSDEDAFDFAVTSATKVDLGSQDFQPNKEYKMKSMMDAMKSGDDSDDGGW